MRRRRTHASLAARRGWAWAALVLLAGSLTGCLGASAEPPVLATTASFGLPPDTYVAWSYDAIYLLAAALAEAPAGPSELSAARRAARFAGVQGRYRFDERGAGLHQVIAARMDGRGADRHRRPLRRPALPREPISPGRPARRDLCVRPDRSSS